MDINIFNSYEEAALHHLKVWGRWSADKTARAEARLEFYKRSLNELLQSPARRSQLEGEVASLEADIRICGHRAE